MRINCPFWPYKDSLEITTVLKYFIYFMNALTANASIFTTRISNRLQEPLEDLLYLSDALSLWLQLLDHQLLQTQRKMIFCSH